MILVSGQNDDGAGHKTDAEKFDKAIHVIVGDPKFLSSCRANFQWLEPFLPSTWVIFKSYNEVDNQAVDHFLQEANGGRSLIFVHGLWPTNKEILKFIKPSAHKTIGFLWGGDYTHDTLAFDFLYESRTRKMIQSRSRKLKRLPFFAFEIVKIIQSRLQLLAGRRNLRNSLSRIDYVVCGWGIAESRKLPARRLRTLPSFNPYYTETAKNKNFNPDEFDERETLAVLVGNSGTWTNNHIDVIETIRLKNPSLSLKFTLLLSYGDKEYIRMLEDFFEHDSKVRLVKNFLSADDFNALVKAHDLLALGSKRQQGSGFIRYALWNNKPILLFEDSIAFSCLHELGANMSSLDVAIDFVSLDVDALRVQFERLQKENTHRFQDKILQLINGTT